MSGPGDGYPVGGQTATPCLHWRIWRFTVASLWRLLHLAWVRYVLTQVLELPENVLTAGAAIPTAWQVGQEEHGETLAPDLAMVDPGGGRARLLVQIWPSLQGNARLRTTARTIHLDSHQWFAWLEAPENHAFSYASMNHAKGYIDGFKEEKPVVARIQILPCGGASPIQVTRHNDLMTRFLMITFNLLTIQLTRFLMI